MTTAVATDEDFLGRVAETLLKFPYVTPEGHEGVVGHEELDEDVLSAHGAAVGIVEAVRLVAQEDPQLTLAAASLMVKKVPTAHTQLSEYFHPRADPRTYVRPHGEAPKRAARVKEDLEHMSDAPEWTHGTFLSLAIWTITYVCGPQVYPRLKQPLVGSQDGEGLYHSRASALREAREQMAVVGN